MGSGIKRESNGCLPQINLTHLQQVTARAHTFDMIQSAHRYAGFGAPIFLYHDKLSDDYALTF
jgi:hypothetical protein